MTENQKRIVKAATMTGGVITTKEAIAIIGSSYYWNGAKHTGEVLNRMVKSGMLKRTQRGIYEIEPLGQAPAPSNDNQIKLFEV